MNRSVTILVFALLMLVTGPRPHVWAVETLPVEEVIAPITGDDLDLEIFPKPRQERYTGRAVRLERAEIQSRGVSKLPGVLALGKFLQANQLVGTGRASFRFARIEDEVAKRWGDGAAQGYQLSVKAGEQGTEVEISAHQPAGIFNAVLTLQQLCHRKDGHWYVREASIEDWPSIRLRGLEVWRGNETHYRELAQLFSPYKLNAVWSPATIWPPVDPDAEQFAKLSDELVKLGKSIATEAGSKKDTLEGLLDGEDKTPKPKKSLKDETAKLANVPERLAEKKRVLEKELAVLKTRRDAVMSQGEESNKDKASFYRSLNIRPVVALRPTADFSPGEKHVDRLQQTYSAWHKLGVREFVFDCDRTRAERGWKFKYGEAQAQVCEHLNSFVKKLNGDARFYFWHQNCLGTPTSDSIDEMVQEGIPKDLQMVWIGKDIYTPRLTADDLTAYQSAFPGARARMLFQLWPGGKVGEDLGPFPAHDAEVTKQTNAFFLRFQIGRESQQLAFLSALDWAWNPTEYDPVRSMKVSAREWARRGKNPPATYRALVEMMDWLRTNTPGQLHPEQATLDPQEVQRLADRHEEIFTVGLKTLKEQLGETGLAAELASPAGARIREFSKVAALRNRFEPTEEEARLGHVVFSRSLFDYARPDEPPLREWITDRLENYGAPGQLVTTKFCLHALRDYTEIETDGCQLVGRSGTIDKQHVDLSVLRWHGKGSADTPSAEMLVKDDRVRLRGVLKETGLLPQVRLEGPVTTGLAQNHTKEFWIQTRIPQGTPAGIYRGTISVRLDQRDVKLPFALEVLPIELKKPKHVLWGIWHPPGWTEARNWDELTAEEQQKRPMTRDIFERYVKALGDCGFNTFTTPLWDDPRYPEVCRMMKKYGMHADYNFANGMAWAYRDDGNPEAYRYQSPWLKKKFDLTAYTQAGIEYARANELPIPLLSMEDETTNVGVIERRTKMMNAAGGHGWSCIHKNWHNMSKALGWAIQNGGINRIDAAHVHRAGHFAAAYHQSYLGINPGRGQRVQFGVSAWNNSVDGFLPYTAMRYKNYPFDETKERSTFMTVYPSLYGPILSTRYLGWREGVDDYRYAYTLKLLLDEKEADHADDPEKMNQLMLLRSAMNHHLQLSPDDEWRRTLANWIIKVEEI